MMKCCHAVEEAEVQMMGSHSRKTGNGSRGGRISVQWNQQSNASVTLRSGRGYSRRPSVTFPVLHLLSQSTQWQCRRNKVLTANSVFCFSGCGWDTDVLNKMKQTSAAGNYGLFCLLFLLTSAQCKAPMSAHKRLVAHERSRAFL